MEETRTAVDAALEKIRPFLQNDGGDVELVDISDEGMVVVRLLGNCVGCSMNGMTFEHGIKQTILSRVREVKDVSIVSE